MSEYITEHMSLHAAPGGNFSAEEQAAFKKDDVEAAGNIVKLMIGIFLGGIVLYSIVCLSIIS